MTTYFLSVRNRVFWFLLICLAVLGCKRSETMGDDLVLEPWIGTGKYSILVDTIRQWEARPDFVLDDYEFRYCHSQSTSRLLANLNQHDFKYRQAREGRLDYDTLKAHDVLLINIPTSKPGGRSVPDRKFPPYGDDEIAAIVRFVEEGGGLFVIAEHNNAYDHCEVLNPLLKHFEVQVPAAYAREKPLTKYSIGTAAVLIRIHNYKKHPVTRKVRETSWLGGGPLTTDHGVAFLSDQGHVDFGNYITGKPMKHSNGRVEEGEYRGPGIPVVAAVEKGKGRVVVIGDHNVMGLQWLGIADNYRFGMNVFAWLTHRENENPHIADAQPMGLKIGFDLPHTDWAPGLRDRRGYHPMFINFSRDPRLFPMGLLDLDDPADMLFLTDPEEEYNEKDLAKIDKRLAAGQRVVLLVDPSEPQKGSVQLMKHLLPDLSITTTDLTMSLSDLEPGKKDLLPHRSGQALPVYSEALGLKGDIKAAAIKPSYRGKGRYLIPDKIEEGEPYLLDIRIEQGSPFISAKTPEGQEITIARSFSVGGGEVILFVQGRMWNNETFGTMRDEPVHDAAYGAHDLQLAFGRWLAEGN